MPIWAYDIPSLVLALLMILTVMTVSLIGLVLVRRLLLPRLQFSDGINDAVSGTVQAIGVFYGITVGLIAVGVWNTNSSSADLVSREAASLGALYRDCSGYPEPARSKLQSGLRDYTHQIIEQAWPAQRQGRIIDSGTQMLNDFQVTLMSFEPATPGQTVLHGETLRAYNIMIGYRRQRIDAVGAGLSQVMWIVIWIGAAISIGVAYFFKIEDPKIHAILIALMAGFLAMVIFMIVVNDRPFSGKNGIPPDSYKLILDKLIEAKP